MDVAHSDQVVVVTGASKGIGAAIAMGFGAAGANVVVDYARDAQGAAKVVESIRAAGGQATAVQADVSVEEDVKKLFGGVREQFGRLDVLVNNAGVYAFGAIEAVTVEEFRRQYDINVLGLLLCIREAVPLFAERGGAIVNIGSVVSTLAPPESAIYTGTKAAVDGITRSLAKELGPRGIRVNAVNPGPVDTEGTVATNVLPLDGEARRQLQAMSPLGRIGAPQDIVGTVMHLASPQAGWVTGELWAVGGGIR